MSVTPPPLVLLCMGECHGHFYLALDADESPVCPFDSEHPVAVYRLHMEMLPGVGARLHDAAPFNQDEHQEANDG